MPSSHNRNTFAHLIFCTLTALYLARQEHGIDTPYAENIFLLRWLKLVQKQKRFAKTMVPNIDLLIRLGQKQGITGGLRSALEELWRESCPHDLLRLTQAIEALITAGWENATVTDEKWDAGGNMRESSDNPAFFVCRSGLEKGFAENGELIHPVDFVVYGDTTLFIDAFSQYQLVAKPGEKKRADGAIVTLMTQ